MMAMQFQVVKRNTRLLIIDSNNHVIYCPPDFVRPYIINRDQMNNLCQKFNEKGKLDIDSIMEFEDNAGTKRIKKIRLKTQENA